MKATFDMKTHMEGIYMDYDIKIDDNKKVMELTANGKKLKLRRHISLGELNKIIDLLDQANAYFYLFPSDVLEEYKPKTLPKIERPKEKGRKLGEIKRKIIYEDVAKAITELLRSKSIGKKNPHKIDISEITRMMADNFNIKRSTAKTKISGYYRYLINNGYIEKDGRLLWFKRYSGDEILNNKTPNYDFLPEI